MDPAPRGGHQAARVRRHHRRAAKRPEGDQVLKKREQGLAARREELVARSAAQRAALTVIAEPLLRKAASVDRVVSYVRRNPVITGLAVGGVALLGPRRLWDLGARAITLYTLLRR